jgi:hypothetical protein
MTVDERRPVALALAEEARTHVAHAIQLLQRPDVEAFDQTTVLLAAAVGRMRQIQTEPGGVGMAVQSAIGELRNDLRRVRVLMGHAWEFRLHCCGQAVYTSKGELTARPSAVGRWAFEA